MVRVADEAAVHLTAAATAQTTWETYRALPVPDKPYTDDDVQVLAEILRNAERSAHTEGQGTGKITLLQLINSYETVLRKMGIQPAEDVYYYRFLLKLALDPSPDWWAKFEREVIAEGLTTPTFLHLRGDSNPLYSNEPSPPKMSPVQPLFEPSLSSPDGPGQSLEGYAPLLNLNHSSSGFYDPPSHLDISRVSDTPLRSSGGRSGGHTQLPYDAGVAYSLGQLAALAGPKRLSAGSGGSRAAREHAIENWMIALSFWECKTCQRFLRTWRNHNRKLLDMALAFWQGGTERAVFDRWRNFVLAGWQGLRHADFHHTTSRRRSILQQWFINAREQRWQNQMKDKALVDGSFQLWRAEAQELIQLRWASEQVVAAAQGRMASQCWAVWRQAFMRRVTHRHLLQGALTGSAERIKINALRRWRRTTSESNGLRKRIIEVVKGMTDVRASTGLVTWLATMAKSTAHYAQVEQCVRRLRVLLLSCAFYWWGHWSSDRGKRYRTMRRTIAHLCNLKTSRAFRGWSSSAAHKRENRRKVFMSVSRISHGLMGRALNSWRGNVQEIHRGMALLNKSVMHFVHRALAVALFTWSDWARHKASLKQKALAAIGKAVHTTENRAFQTWADFLITRRHKLEILQRALSHMSHGFLHKALGGWCHAVDEIHRKRALLRKAVSHMAHCFLLIAMNGWMDFVQHKQYKEGLLHQAVKHMAHSFLFKAFDSWLEAREHRQHLLQVAAKTAGRLMNNQLHRAFQAWADRVQQKILEMGLVSRSVAKLMNRRVSMGFEAWSEWAYRRARQKATVNGSIQKMKAASLISAWNKWRECFQEALAARMAMERAVRHMMNTTVAKSWAAWWEFLAERARMRTLMTRAVGRWDNTLISIALTHWKNLLVEKAEKMELALRSLSKMMQRELARAFVRWIEFRAQRVRQRAQVRNAINYFRNRSVALAFWTWWEWCSDKAELMQKASRAVGHMQNRMLASAWLRWRDFVQEMRQQRRAASKAVGYWSNHRLGPAFLAWIHWARDQVRKKQKASRAITHWHQATISSALHVWRAKTLEGLRLKDKMAYAVLHWRSQQLACAFAGWQEWFSYEVYKRTISDKALRFWYNHHRGAAFRGWQDRARYLSEKKEKLTAAVMFWENLFVGSAFMGWAYSAQRMAAKREKVLKALLFWENQCIGSAFFGWWYRAKDMVTAKDKLSTAVRFWRNHFLGAALVGWQDSTRQQMKKREKVASAILFWRNMLLGSSFFGWHYKAWRRKEKMAKVGRAVGYWVNAELKKGFNRMVDNVIYRSKARLAAKRWRHAIGIKALDGWREVAVKQRAAIRRWFNSTLNKVKRMSQQLLWSSFSSLNAHRFRMRGVQGILNRILSREVSRSFNAWRAWHGKMQGVRDLLRRVLGGLKEAAFFNWRLAVEENVYERESQDFIEDQVLSNEALGDHVWRALLRWQHLSEAMVLEQWAEYVHRSHVLRSKIEMAFKRRYYGLAQRAFFALCDHASYSSGKKRRIAVALEFWGGRTMALAFRHWREKAGSLVVDRLVAVKALYSYALQIKRRALQAWQEELMYQQAVREKLQWTMMHMAGFRVRTYFDLWRAAAKHLRLVNRKLNILTVKLLGNKMRNAWDSWCNFMDWQTWLEGCNYKALDHFMLRTGTLVLAEWRRAAAESSRYETIVSYCLPRHNQFMLASAFYAWLDVLQAIYNLRVASHAFIFGLMGKAFRRWHSVWREIRVRRAVAHHIVGSMRRALTAWVEVVMLQKAKQQAFAGRQFAINSALAYGDAIARERRRDLVTSVLVAWRLQVGLFKRVRKMMTRRFTDLQRAVLAEWMAVVRDHDILEKQANADRMASMYRKLHSFRRWQGFVILQAERYYALRAAMEVIVQADEVADMTKKFKRWREHVAMQRAKMLRARGAIRHHKFATKHYFFFLWANFCRAMRQDEPLDYHGTRALKAVRNIAGSLSPSRSGASAAALKLGRRAAILSPAGEDAQSRFRPLAAGRQRYPHTPSRRSIAKVRVQSDDSDGYEYSTPVAPHVKYGISSGSDGQSYTGDSFSN